MKNRKTYYVVENIGEISIIFADPKMTSKVEKYLLDKHAAGEIYCKVTADKKNFNHCPKIKSVKTVKEVPKGDTDYVEIVNFLK